MIFILNRRKAKKNKLADALSRKYEDETKEVVCVMMILGPSLEWVQQLKANYAIDPHFQHLIEQFHNSPDLVTLFSMVIGILSRQDKTRSI